MRFFKSAVLPATFFLLAGAAQAKVVINEIFYHAPNDMDELQWVELYNTADETVSLGDWKLDDGKLFSFSLGAKIEGRAYLVLALNPAEFRKVYVKSALGPLKRPLKRGGERLHLSDDKDALVDVVRYKDKTPWPVSADGYSASLERISPSSSGESAENWAASPMPSDKSWPSGTPGKVNSCFSATLPPTIVSVTTPKASAQPNHAIPVEAVLKEGESPKRVTLLYRTVAKGVPGPESEVAMALDPGAGRYRAEIPPQKENTLVRYRVRAVGDKDAQRYYPAPGDLRPALSIYVHKAGEMAGVPFGILLGSPN